MKNRRSISNRLQNDEEESLLNLTPLIDVVFVVLIIFILIAPMLDIDKIQLAASSTKKEKTTPEASPITIQVKEDNSIWIQKKKVSYEELFQILVQEKKKHPNRIPQLFQDKKAQFGTYQTIKNSVENAGFEELDVILQPGSP